MSQICHSSGTCGLISVSFIFKMWRLIIYFLWSPSFLSLLIPILCVIYALYCHIYYLQSACLYDSQIINSPDYLQSRVLVYLLQITPQLKQYLKTRTIVLTGSVCQAFRKGVMGVAFSLLLNIWGLYGETQTNGKDRGQNHLEVPHSCVRC